MADDKDPLQYCPEEFADLQNYKRKPVPFTMERRMRFLWALRKVGRMYQAAELAGVTTGVVNRLRKEEPEFDEAVDQAMQRWVDEVLVSSAVHRAVDGVQRPIVGRVGKDEDGIICYETVYSDSLLALLLKAKRPEFRDAGTSGPGGKYEQGGGGVIVIPAGPATVEDWEAKCSEAANPRG